MKMMKLLTYKEFQDYFTGCDINVSKSVLNYFEGKDIYIFTPYTSDRVFFMIDDNTNIVIQAVEDAPIPEALRAAGFRNDKVKIVAGLCDQKVIHYKAEMKGHYRDLCFGIDRACRYNLTEPVIRIDGNNVVWVQYYSNTNKPIGCWKKAGEILSQEVDVCNLLDVDNVSAASVLLCEAFDIHYQSDIDSSWLTRDDTEPDMCSVDDVSTVKMFGFSTKMIRFNTAIPYKESYDEVRTIELYFLVSTSNRPDSELDFDEHRLDEVISYFTGK